MLQGPFADAIVSSLSLDQSY